MDVARLPYVMALIHDAQPAPLSASQKRWLLAIGRASLGSSFFFVFMLGYKAKATQPPEIHKTIVDRVEVQEVVVPSADYDKLKREEYDKERAELNALREKIRGEGREMREKALAERKELTRQRMDVMAYWMSEIGEKEFQEELEKEVDKRIKLRQERMELQDPPR